MLTKAWIQARRPCGEKKAGPSAGLLGRGRERRRRWRARLIVFLRSGQHCSCLYLGITRTEAFLWRVMLVILMFVA